MRRRVMSWFGPVFILLPLAAMGQGVQRPAPPPETDMSHDGWYAEMPPALAEARRTGKDLLIVFGGSDWCAPCKWLKYNILVKPEFNQLASKYFVRVDIDTLARGLSPERRARYIKLQEQYKVGNFPSVFLTTPDGKPYAWTTYIPPKDGGSPQQIRASVKLDTPERFWTQLQPFIARGKAFRAGLARAAKLSGPAKADALIDALSQVRADFLEYHYPDQVAELRTLDPADHRGFLAYLDGCKAYNDLELRIGGGYHLKPEVKVTDVDALIARYRLQGETLQQALAMKATLLVVGGKPRAALDAIAAFVAAQDSRGPFDRGDYMQVTPATIIMLKQRIAEGTASGAGIAAQYLALHRLFENQELPNRYKVSCHASQTSAFEPVIAVRVPIGDGYGKALLQSTASLQGEARARALGKGLKGTVFRGERAIRTIVTQTIPDLVGAGNAAAYLPEYYQSWGQPRPR